MYLNEHISLKFTKKLALAIKKDESQTHHVTALGLKPGLFCLQILYISIVSVWGHCRSNFLDYTVV